jgi:hypothetical protein
MKVYVRSNFGNNIIILNGSRHSFRCRQRSKLQDGSSVPSLKFISYKAMIKDVNKNNKGLVGPLQFNTMSNL